MKDLKHYALLANQCKKPREVNCSLTLEVDGEAWNAYSVAIAHNDLMFSTDKGTATYLVDDYGGGKLTVELYDWQKDEE